MIGVIHVRDAGLFNTVLDTGIFSFASMAGRRVRSDSSTEACLLVFGTSGVVGAGWMADALRRRGYSDANLRVIMIGALCSIPFGVAAPLVDNIWFTLALMAPFTFCWSLPHGIAPAALQPITPNQMRAQVSALYLLAVNLIGLGIGPTFVALLTDYLYGDPALVGHSLATVVCNLGAVICAHPVYGI